MTEAMILSAAKDVEMSAAFRAAERTTATAHLPKLRPAELSFLLGVLASARDASPPIFPANGNAALLWECLERHGLGGVLGDCVERVTDLPQDLAEAARHRYWSNCLHGTQARQRCATLVEAGQRAGLRVLFVKGPALVDQSYGDDGLRGYSDLDLFTGSADNARRLASACGARVLIDSERQGLCSEIWDSGRLVAELDGWPVEIRFPVAGWTGPLFDMFPNGDLPELVWTATRLPAPQAEWHFLFLLHHLMMHHFFGRFVWFLDLAMLVRRQGLNLGWDRVVSESGRLGMGGGLAAAASFCRRHVDPDFPEVPPVSGRAWNRPFIHHLVQPLVIASSERNKQQASALGRVWAVLHGAPSYLLLADAPATGRPWNGRGGQWTTARVRCVLASRWRGKWGTWFAARLSTVAIWLVYPLARMLAWIPARQNSQ